MCGLASAIGITTRGFTQGATGTPQQRLRPCRRCVTHVQCVDAAPAKRPGREAAAHGIEFQTRANIDGGRHMAEDEQKTGGKTPIAVFDYDGTIIDGQSGSLFGTYLLSHGLISIRTGLRLVWWGARYKLHLPYRQDEARELIFHDLARLERSETLRIMCDFHDEVLKPLYRADAMAEVRRRHDEGLVTLLVSATFYEIAHVAAAYLGMDGVAATHMELDANDHFTGRVEGEVVAGPGKVHATHAWADENLGAGTWRIACAYGDHFTDEPLLEQADEPFAVCPGATLAHMAKRRKWPVLDWN